MNAIYLDQSVEYFDKLSDDDRKSYTNYMVNRFISMNPGFVEVVNEFQQYYGEVGPRESYLFYSQCLPKGKQWNRYIKSSQEAKYEEWLVGLVGNHFSVSYGEAETYLAFYLATPKGREHLRVLLEKYGTDMKHIRKILG